MLRFRVNKGNVSSTFWKLGYFLMQNMHKGFLFGHYFLLQQFTQQEVNEQSAEVH